MTNEVIVGLMEVIDRVLDMNISESNKEEIIGLIHKQAMVLAQ